MKKNNKKLLNQVKELIQQSHQQFEINRDQTEQRVLFDTLVAIDKSSKLLQDAWNIGQNTDITNQDLRDDFIDTFSDFAKVRQNLNKEFKYKQ